MNNRNKILAIKKMNKISIKDLINKKLHKIKNNYNYLKNKYKK